MSKKKQDFTVGWDITRSIPRGSPLHTSKSVSSPLAPEPRMKLSVTYQKSPEFKCSQPIGLDRIDEHAFAWRETVSFAYTIQPPSVFNAAPLR